MKHPVTDKDTHFIIDGATRLVKNESDVKSMLVQNDHNSEQFTFKVPREFDNHDLSLCNTVRVHFINVDKSKRMESKKFSLITETLRVCPDDDTYVLCSWLIPREATLYAGILSFVIEFACIEDEKTLYSWNTAKYSGVTIADGLNAVDESIEEYSDILTKWENELKANQITKIEQTTVSTEDEGVNVWTATFGDGRTQDFQVRNGSKGSTGLIGSIETIQGNTLHFFVGTQYEYDNELTPEQKVNLFAIITDDEPNAEDISEAVENIKKIISGETAVKEAESITPNLFDRLTNIVNGNIAVVKKLTPNRLYAISYSTVAFPAIYRTLLLFYPEDVSTAYSTEVGSVYCYATEPPSNTSNSNYLLFEGLGDSKLHTVIVREI